MLSVSRAIPHSHRFHFARFNFKENAKDHLLPWLGHENTIQVAFLRVCKPSKPGWVKPLSSAHRQPSNVIEVEWPPFTGLRSQITLKSAVYTEKYNEMWLNRQMDTHADRFQTRCQSWFIVSEKDANAWSNFFHQILSFGEGWGTSG